VCAVVERRPRHLERRALLTRGHTHRWRVVQRRRLAGVAWYEDGAAPPGYESVGVCTVPG